MKFILMAASLPSRYGEPSHYGKYCWSRGSHPPGAELASQPAASTTQTARALAVWKSLAVVGLDPSRVEGWGTLFAKG